MCSIGLIGLIGNNPVILHGTPGIYLFIQMENDILTTMTPELLFDTSL